MGVFRDPWRGHSPFEPIRRPPRRGARTYRSSQAYDNSNQAQASNSDTSQDAANEAREAWWAIADFSNLVSRYGFDEAIRISTGRGMRPTDVQNEANMLRDAGLRPEQWSEPPVTPEDIDTGDTGVYPDDNPDPALWEEDFRSLLEAQTYCYDLYGRILDRSVPCAGYQQEWQTCSELVSGTSSMNVGVFCGWLPRGPGLP